MNRQATDLCTRKIFSVYLSVKDFYSEYVKKPYKSTIKR